MAGAVFAAVDLGASSGRVVAGVVGDHIDLHEVHRFPNAMTERDGHLRWDLSRLYAEITVGLQRVGDPVSIGVDTWGVDYGLLDAEGQLLAEPIAYRDSRTNGIVDRVHRTVSLEQLYAVSGVQFLPFNTIYQLAAEREGPLWSRVSHAVLIPDLLAFWLTGRLASEITNASTTGLLDARTGGWSDRLFEVLDFDRELLPEIEKPGSTRGMTADGVPVVTVGSHDTASAVVGVPATAEHFCYVSCGTWSLVGLELERPVLTDDARSANFTNEVGVDGRTRFLRNVGGLWPLQECLREWGSGADLDGLLGAAATRPAGGPRIDVGAPDLVAPGPMAARIAKAALGEVDAMDRPAVVRCIVDSLASAYANAIAQARDVAEKRVDVIHVVGGGSQNALLCQLTADATGLPVIAGPAEATALGNIAVQARSRGVLSGSLEELRGLVAVSSGLRHFEPR